MGKLSGLRELPRINSRVGFYIEEHIFQSQLACRPRDLLRHASLIVLHKREQVHKPLQVWSIEFFRVGFFDHGLSFPQLTQKEIGESQVLIVVTARRFKAKGLAGLSQGLVMLPESHGNLAQVSRRNEIPRIGLCPEFVGLARLFEVAGGNLVVVGLDLQPLALGDPLAQLVSLPNIVRGQSHLPEIAINSCKQAIGPGKIRIQADCALCL